MASNEITIKFDGEFANKINQKIRDVVMLEFGEVWEEYCFDNNVPADIKIGFLDYWDKFLKSIEMK